MAKKSKPKIKRPLLKNLIVIRGTEAWKEWIDGYAKRKGMPTIVLLDQAVREMAKRDSHPEAPSRVS